jgi:RNA polymerase sigma-70 factor, ECF subfamily
MDESQWLAERFEAHRPHLRAVAYRMVGSISEADDALQEAWLRLSRSDVDNIENLGAWLTTVVARVCLNMLQQRRSRREDSLDAAMSSPYAPSAQSDQIIDPEQETLLANSVGLALLVVLDTLSPAERLALVLHDMFDLPFNEIAPLVGRSPTTARKLASRARHRVRGAPAVPHADLVRQRAIVDAFLAASGRGDFDALVALLDPDVVLRADGSASPDGESRVLRGAESVAGGALMFSGRVRFSQPALVNGAVGVVVAPRGLLFIVLGFAFADQKIAEIDVIADPARLRELDLAALED